MLMIYNPQHLAVVPIFVNAGSALLPAIAAPILSMLALLLKPRELVRVCKAKPVVPVAILLAGAGAWFGLMWLFGHGQTAAARERPERAGRVRTDWAKVAQNLIDSDQPDGVKPVTTRPVSQLHEALVFRYNFARCGHDGGPSPLALKQRWEYNPEEGTMYLSSPLVVGDRVYGAACTSDVAGYIGAIFCLSAADGKPIWNIDSLERTGLKPFFSSPAITADGKYLLIGQGLHEDADSYLICLEAATGKLHWRVKTPLHIEGSPAVLGDMVVAGAGAIEDDDHKPKTHPGFVLAVRISDGQELWRADVNDPESSPAISKDGIVYIGSGFQGNAIVALRSEPDDVLIARGQSRILWKQSVVYPATGAITLVDDLVIAGVGNGDYVFSAKHPAGVVVALNAKTGDVRWRVHMPDSVLGAVAARDGKLICPVSNGEVVMLNQADGAITWRQRISGSAAVLAGPAFTGKYVYAVSKDGYLAVLGAKDGTILEKHFLNAEGKPGEKGLGLSSPLIAAGRVYVGSETGGIRCFVGGKVVE